MKIFVVGATGGLGRDVVADSLACGHASAALVRDPARAALPSALEFAVGDVLDRDSLGHAVAGREAVICALGTPSPRKPSTLLRDGTKNVIAAMTEHDVRRLVCVTLLGTGASRSQCSLVYRELTLRALAPMLADKEAQEQVVGGSDRDWVLVRPPRFTRGTPSGNLRVLPDSQLGRLGHVVRADLARFLVDCAAGTEHSRQALSVGS
jgi:uncharacterized protein YbjT (DUF2867 family)